MSRTAVLLVPFVAFALACGSQSEDRTPEAKASPNPASKLSEPVQQARGYRMQGNQIVADVFDVQHELNRNQLTLELDTDLGDSAALTVTVSRSYLETGNDDLYSKNYFYEKSTVGEWRQARTISLDHGAWRGQVEELQRTMASVGEPFTVRSVSDDIEISFLVPVNQDPPFEKLNSNLTGEAVRKKGALRLVEAKASLHYPLDSNGGGGVAYADPLQLQVGKAYRTSDEYPLTPGPEPADPISAAAAIRTIPASVKFTVIGLADRGGARWYQVRTDVGDGWINSIALTGDEVGVVTN